MTPSPLQGWLLFASENVFGTSHFVSPPRPPAKKIVLNFFFIILMANIIIIIITGNHSTRDTFLKPGPKIDSWSDAYLSNVSKVRTSQPTNQPSSQPYNSKIAHLTHGIPIFLGRMICPLFFSLFISEILNILPSCWQRAVFKRCKTVCVRTFKLHKATFFW